MEIEHLDKKEFYRVWEVNKLRKTSRNDYSRIYYKVTKEWSTPEKWFKSKQKRIHLGTRVTDCYWIAWSMINQKKLPVDFINKLRLNNTHIILSNTLNDYEKLVETYEKMKNVYSKASLKHLFPIVLKTCLYKGVNNIKDIKIEDVSNAARDGVLNHDGYKSKMANLLYYMGYTNQAYKDSKLHHKLNDRKQKLSTKWSKNMKSHIQRFINNLYNSRITTYKMEKEKKNGLNLFVEWYSEKIDTEKIDNLLDFTRQQWIDYIDYVNKLDNISNKSKQNKLRAVKDFVEWAQVKVPHIVPKENFISSEDYKNISYHSSSSLAFEKREHGERIINYLINDFKTENIREMFRKEAIIIAANSGMRISEIKRLEYGSCFFSEDEGLYKIILDYPDKLGQVNRPVYLTRQGYEAIKRVEELRKSRGVLKERYNERVKRKFVHLFEYQGSNPLNSQSMSAFINKIKMNLGLLDQNGNVVKGGMHAWRHFFAMTVFKESNYNIGVVRYLLGHRNYNMSFQYLDEEKEKIYKEVKNQNSNRKNYSGEGLNTLIDILLNNHKKKYKALSEILKRSKKLSDLINFKHIKKVSFGYCLNPCENANRCLRCKNFFLSKDNEEEIIQATIDLFELICYKISLFDSPKIALDNAIIQKDISDLKILISEIVNLNISTSKLPIELKKVI